MESVKNLSLHSRVYIELNKDEDCYTGTLTQYHSKFKCIELTELTGIKSKKKFDGAHRFYEQEIEKITALDARPSVSVESTKSSIASDQKESSHNDIISLQSERIKSRYVDSAFPLDLDTDNKSNESEFKSVEDGSNHYDFLMESNTTTIGDAEQEQINEKICSAVHIIQCDASYHAALNDLRRQEIVGFNVEGSRLGRLQEGSLLSFSTNEKIYLFDLMMLGRIFPEIKRILEAEKPRKVVHNSCLIVDHLKHRYKCQLNGIHDTLVSFLLSSRQRRIFLLWISSPCFTDHPFSYQEKEGSHNDWRLFERVLQFAHQIIHKGMHTTSRSYNGNEFNNN